MFNDIFKIKKNDYEVHSCRSVKYIELKRYKIIIYIT